MNNVVVLRSVLYPTVSKEIAISNNATDFPKSSFPICPTDTSLILKVSSHVVTESMELDFHQQAATECRKL
jgi:hypothetical protein